MKFLKKIAHNIRVHGHTTWLCARDPELGWALRLLALLIAGYALSPIDLIPDFIPVIGLLDDAILIPLGIWLLRKAVPPDVFARNHALAEMAAERPVGKTAAAIIITLWLGLALWIAYTLDVPRLL